MLLWIASARVSASLLQQASGALVVSMLARLALYLEIVADEDCLPDVPIVAAPSAITAATVLRRSAEQQLPILREAVHAVLLLHHSVQLDIPEAQMYQQVAFVQVRSRPAAGSGFSRRGTR